MNANPETRSTSITAILSLVFGLLAWGLLPVIGAIVAIVCGQLARAEIRRNPSTLEGDGFAIAGLVLGWLHIVLALAAVLVAILFFRGLLAVFGGSLAVVAAVAPVAAIG